MKKTSAGVEKVARPVRRDLAASLSPSDSFDASGVAGSRRAEGTGGTDLSHSVTSLSASGDNPPFLHPTPSFPPSYPLLTSSSPSLPAPFTTQLQ
ncbi:hypothetical protein NQZ68_007720 [Dissostichus eleginoides]|nr:hypothetical protein NQZ68_007720 [Dissostichus eleginoides]